MTIIITLIIISILVVAHEFGHFIMAKRAGIGVEEFSVGMGPKLFGIKRKETEYTLRLLPIGGYVMLVGQGEESNDPNSFTKKSVLSRFSVMVAGPLMNILIAVFFFVGAFMYYGVPSNDPVIGEVHPDSPAYVAGVQAGDEVVSIDGQQIDNWKSLVSDIRAVEGVPLEFVVLRDGQEIALTVTPQYNEEYGYVMIGITQSLEKMSVWGSLKYGALQTYYFTKELILILIQMFTGEIAPDFAGPVGIVDMVGEVVQTGYMQLLSFAGILSVNLAIMNLLPIPGLDGSRLLFLIFEAIRGKPVNPDKEAAVHFIGIVFLLVVMIMVTYNDIVRLFN